MKAKWYFLNFAAIAVFALSGCAETTLFSHFIKRQESQKVAGTYKVGNPYLISGVKYVPQEKFNLIETGVASWYGPDFHGGKTANGEIYDQNEMTAAHRTLQMPSFVRVTNLENGRSVVVRVNDRGPYLRGRIIDVSKRAAQLLDFTNKGTARVRLEVLGPESRQIANAAKRGVNTSRMTLADFQGADFQRAAPENIPAVSGVQVASLQNDVSLPPQSDGELLPESLQTPTITVEQLDSPGVPGVTGTPTWTDAKPMPGVAATRREDVAVHMDKKGRVMPDPVVTTEKVRPTGLFVQAGAFSVYGNAQRLAKNLAKIAPSDIESTTVNGRAVHRVKLGPFTTIASADKALEKVAKAGQSNARIIKN